MALGRDAGMEVGQRLFVIEPIGLGNKTVDELQDAVGAIGKALEKLFAVDAFARFSLVEPAFRAGRILGGRHPDEGHIIEALEMGAFFLELLAALNIDEGGDPVRKLAAGIVLGRNPARLDKNRPAAPQPAQGVVEPRCRADELGRRGAVEVRTTESCRALKRAILVEHDPRRDQSRPGQKIGEALRLLAIFGEVQHRLTPRNARGSADGGAPRRRIAHPASRPRPPRHGRSPK